MSNTLIENAPPVPASHVKRFSLLSPRQLVEQATLSPWSWCAITCVLLLISGGIRFWREAQFRSISRAGSAVPFPLSELPRELGSWRVVEGSEQQLDEEIARTAGSSDHFIRAYVDSKSGERVSVLVLFGLAEAVSNHPPSSCYPAAGYEPVPNQSVERELPLAGLRVPARYAEAYYGRSTGGVSEYVEVLWTFRNNGDWLPDMKERWKGFRYHPGMFKVQIHRPAISIASEDGPAETLLNSIVREIEIRMSARERGVAKDAALDQASTK
jgi:hypothetical protein